MDRSVGPSDGAGEYDSFAGRPHGLLRRGPGLGALGRVGRARGGQGSPRDHTSPRNEPLAELPSPAMEAHSSLAPGNPRRGGLGHQLGRRPRARADHHGSIGGRTRRASTIQFLDMSAVRGPRTSMGGARAQVQWCAVSQLTVPGQRHLAPRTSRSGGLVLTELSRDVTRKGLRGRSLPPPRTPLERGRRCVGRWLLSPR